MDNEVLIGGGKKIGKCLSRCCNTKSCQRWEWVDTSNHGIFRLILPYYYVSMYGIMSMRYGERLRKRVRVQVVWHMRVMTLLLLMLMASILSSFVHWLLGAYFHGPQNSVQSVVKSY